VGIVLRSLVAVHPQLKHSSWRCFRFGTDWSWRCRCLTPWRRMGEWRYSSTPPAPNGGEWSTSLPGTKPPLQFRYDAGWAPVPVGTQWQEIPPFAFRCC